MRRRTMVDLMTKEEVEALREFEVKIGNIGTVQEMADRCDELKEILKKVPTDDELTKRLEEEADL